ncbi:hypothetical protein GOODEAATRI_016104 [Goodea atripinnis]|uniref:Uncharacterized protein n=1 Tax=Goodea atripinnis TaxID=208336 RepID=A0ABV0NV27_9TELE
MTFIFSPLQEPVQEWGEEEEDGAIFGITLRREPVPPDSPDLLPVFGCVQYHTVKVRRLKAATLERLVSHLLDAEHQEPDFIHVFLSMYRAFTSTDTFIELMFQSMSYFLGRSSVASNVCVAYASEGFMTGQMLQSVSNTDSSLTASSRLISGSQNKSLLTRAGFYGRFYRHELNKAELFVKVVPLHCLGCIWSQRDKKENRNLAPTVRATISQFNAVTNRIPLPSLQSLPGSLRNVAEDFSMSSSSSTSLSGSSCSSSQPDLSCSSLALSPDSSSSSSSQSTCSSQAVLPLYNKQIADSCIIRVTVECVSNGNIYKSILLTSQDHTPQVIQRALEKHNMEDFRIIDFGLYQLLNHGRGE